MEAPSLDLHSAKVLQEGTDLTLITYGPSVRTCLEARRVAETEGKSLEVIDLRSLSPLDLEPVFASIEKTGHGVIVHEAPTFLGMGAELSAQITQECFYSLEAPILRVGGYNVPYPPARIEDHYLPDVDRILDAVDRSFEF